MLDDDRLLIRDASQAAWRVVDLPPGALLDINVSVGDAAAVVALTTQGAFVYLEGDDDWIGAGQPAGFDLTALAALLTEGSLYGLGSDGSLHRWRLDRPAWFELSPGPPDMSLPARDFQVGPINGALRPFVLDGDGRFWLDGRSGSWLRGSESAIRALTPYRDVRLTNDGVLIASRTETEFGFTCCTYRLLRDSSGQLIGDSLLAEAGRLVRVVASDGVVYEFPTGALGGNIFADIALAGVPLTESPLAPLSALAAGSDGELPYRRRIYALTQQGRLYSRTLQAETASPVVLPGCDGDRCQSTLRGLVPGFTVLRLSAENAAESGAVSLAVESLQTNAIVAGSANEMGEGVSVLFDGNGPLVVRPVAYGGEDVSFVVELLDPGAAPFVESVGDGQSLELPTIDASSVELAVSSVPPVPFGFELRPVADQRASISAPLVHATTSINGPVFMGFLGFDERATVTTSFGTELAGGASDASLVVRRADAAQPLESIWTSRLSDLGPSRTVERIYPGSDFADRRRAFISPDLSFALWQSSEPSSASERAVTLLDIETGDARIVAESVALIGVADIGFALQGDVSPWCSDPQANFALVSFSEDAATCLRITPASVSGDGRYVFTLADFEIRRRDLLTGEVVFISPYVNGAPAPRVSSNYSGNLVTVRQDVSGPTCIRDPFCEEISATYLIEDGLAAALDLPFLPLTIDATGRVIAGITGESLVIDDVDVTDDGYVIDLESNSIVRLPRPPDADVSTPRVSPDGRWVTYAVERSSADSSMPAIDMVIFDRESNTARTAIGPLAARPTGDLRDRPKLIAIDNDVRLIIEARDHRIVDGAGKDNSSWFLVERREHVRDRIVQ